VKRGVSRGGPRSTPRRRDPGPPRRWQWRIGQACDTAALAFRRPGALFQMACKGPFGHRRIPLSRRNQRAFRRHDNRGDGANVRVRGSHLPCGAFISGQDAPRLPACRPCWYLQLKPSRAPRPRLQSTCSRARQRRAGGSSSVCPSLAPTLLFLLSTGSPSIEDVSQAVRCPRDTRPSPDGGSSQHGAQGTRAEMTRPERLKKSQPPNLAARPLAGVPRRSAHTPLSAGPHGCPPLSWPCRAARPVSGLGPEMSCP